MPEYLRTMFDKFELRVCREYYYTEEGLWVGVEAAHVRVGVADYLQKTGGDVAFVEFLPERSIVDRRTEMATLETVKTSLSLLSPVSGEIDKVNRTLLEKPELINSDPYGEGWLVLIKPSNLEADLTTLMSAEDYFKLMLKKLGTDHGELKAA